MDDINKQRIVESVPQRGFFGHPKGLFTLFFTEFWGIIGGWLADRIFGASKAVFYCFILIMLGHITLAIPGSISLFFVSMVLIVLGTGLLKPNVSSVVGELYSENDQRRDAGFSIFYMGINLGAFIAPLIIGTIGMGSYPMRLPKRLMRR